MEDEGTRATSAKPAETLIGASALQNASRADSGVAGELGGAVNAYLIRLESTADVGLTADYSESAQVTLDATLRSLAMTPTAEAGMGRWFVRLLSMPLVMRRCVATKGVGRMHWGILYP
jgi:hypothetical protein